MSGGLMKTTFTMKLRNNEATRKKLEIMNQMEAMFDDPENGVPETYWDLVENLQLGDEIRVTVEKLVTERIYMGGKLVETRLVTKEGYGEPFHQRD